MSLVATFVTFCSFNCDETNKVAKSDPPYCRAKDGNNSANVILKTRRVKADNNGKITFTLKKSNFTSQDIKVIINVHEIREKGVDREAFANDFFSIPADKTEEVFSIELGSNNKNKEFYLTIAKSGENCF